jgi:aerobic carbon-monoxide dehydrogenase small subunit
MQVQMKVNGKNCSAEVPPHTLLVQVLRENLKLTGTHVGCDTSQCGACTVLMNGRAVKSCTVLAAQANGAAISTIEGMAQADGTMHPMQAAFKDCHGLQCGFCTPGMVMSAMDLCTQHPKAKFVSCWRAIFAAARATKTLSKLCSKAKRPWPALKGEHHGRIRFCQPAAYRQGLKA